MDPSITNQQYHEAKDEKFHVQDLSFMLLLINSTPIPFIVHQKCPYLKNPDCRGCRGGTVYQQPSHHKYHAIERSEEG